MTDLMERYVYEVVRRLPEKEREDVSRELRANIRDMLPNAPCEEDVREVLTRLGPPALLAEQYRANPRYLISPAVYNDYIRALKWVLPLIGCILLAVGGVFGAIDAIKEGMADAGTFMASVLSSGLSFGVSGALQALIWVTVGFVVAERTGAKTAPAPRAWTVDDLPGELPSDRGRIPLSDSVIELAVSVFFSAAAVLFLTGVLPFPLVIINGSTEVRQIFSDSFLQVLIPMAIIGGLLSVVEGVVKIIKRRWTPVVCGTVVAGNLVGIGLVLYVLTRPDMFSAGFSIFLQTQEWAQIPVFRMGVYLFAAIIVIAILAECAAAVYRTVRAGRSAK